MNTPYLIMDIDGVLIPYPDGAGHSPDTHTRHLVTPTGYERQPAVAIWLNPTHGQMIARFLSETGLTMAWATSWQHDANRLIGSRLGLQASAVIEWDRPAITVSHPNGYLWKRDPVAAWLGNAPAAWIDDDFTPADHAWAAARTLSGIPTILVQPDHHEGLLPTHLNTVAEWASTRLAQAS
ncbi:hypothetical protein KGQ19_41875 [Catenulispora sp. NL8]|uniref:Secreted protein n=1 Tax=Catenulispora pinistramenti TaxID=2705254 RepID=A0ABS5L507_9ACTN|nr:HAD domain-containing protein [Catenulispora pinistramenti]MBS2553423.1 hypothetical protein [Catenulispora pinistramenti]